MAQRSRWIVPEAGGSAVEALRGALRCGAPLAKTLWSRGLRDPDSARRFLAPALEDLHDPFLLRDMDAAVARLLRAVREREKILIYGDYDVDGTTSVVILTKAIELAGGSASYHVPHRLKDGYGMRPEVVETAAADSVRLIVSVDTGIRAAEVVRFANERGIDVIVTDHHLPEAELPPAVAVLNPNRRDSGYPENVLCGAGVAFKLVQGLLGSLGWPGERVRRVTESFLKLAAIGTVADVVPLTGENRVIVKHGLAGLGAVRNPGLRALLDVAGFTAGAVPNARQVAFQIAPRLNAAGRMDTARAVVELFLTSDAARARDLARQLREQNADRQQVEADVRQICDQIRVGEDEAALVYYGEKWHRGVLGIVASRMVERHHRPVFVLGRNEADGLAQGSGRSIPGFHLLEALEAMAGTFVKFGGHEHAAGVTLEPDRVDDFRRCLNAYAAERLTPDDLLRQVQIDAVLDFRELDESSVEEVLSLAPFGHGNPPPVFAAFDVEVAAPPAPLKEKHLRLMLSQNGRTQRMTAWNFASRAAELAPGTRIDVAFSVEEDAYSAARGYPGWAAVLRDFRPAQ